MEGVRNDLKALTTIVGAIPPNLLFGQGVLSDSDPDFGGPAQEMAMQYAVAVQTYLTNSDSAVTTLQNKVGTLSTAAQSAAAIYSNGATSEQAAATTIQQQLSGQSQLPPLGGGVG
jgi:hypothetical protein